MRQNNLSGIPQDNQNFITQENFLSYLKMMYFEQEYIAKTGCQIDKLLKSWSLFSDIHS